MKTPHVTGSTPVRTALLAAGLLLAPRAADAAPGTTKSACIAAFDHAQQARREGALLRAREELVVCSQQECPGLVRADCADVLRQVDAAQPTIVLKAADGKGDDLTDVEVDLGGKSLTTTLDGHAIPVDPGKLSLVFHHAPWKPVTVEIVIAEGEKSRIVSATLGPPPPPVVALTPVRPAAPAKRDAVGWAVPGALAAIGGGALAFAGISRLTIGGEADDLRASCAPRCPVDDYNRLTDDLGTANIMLVVGLGSVALATIAWFVLAPPGAPRSPAPQNAAMLRY